MHLFIRAACVSAASACGLALAFARNTPIIFRCQLKHVRTSLSLT